MKFLDENPPDSFGDLVRMEMFVWRSEWRMETDVKKMRISGETDPKERG